MFKKILIIPLLLFFLSFLTFKSPVLAKISDETVYVPENETINGLYVKVASDITVDGNINGETYLVGKNIIINGDITGDLIAIGANIDINGSVSENARLLGGKIYVSAPIGKNLLVVAGQTDIARKTIIGGNLVLINGQGQIFGQTTGQTKIYSGKIFYNGKAGKDTEIFSSNLSIGKDAFFSENLTFHASREIKNPAKQIHGNFEFIKQDEFFTPLSLYHQNYNFFSKVKSFSMFAGFFSYLVFGLILAFLFPKIFTNIDRFLNDKPLASFIFGLFFYAMFPLIFVLLLITLIGIPMALLSIFCVLILGFVSHIVLALFIGGKILKDEESKFLPLVVGLSIIQLMLFIPFFGMIFRIIIVLLGTGAILLSKFGRYSR